MNNNIEGIILNKIDYKDRHYICHVLMRNGHKTSLLFYGAKGNGNRKKTSQLELGYMIKTKIVRNKITSQLYQTNEWSVVWSHKFISKNYKIFSLMCLYLEILNKVTFSSDDILESNSISDDKKIFIVLSNALYYLDKAIAEGKEVDNLYELSIFLGKLCIVHGICPIFNNCIYCGKNFGKVKVYLVNQQGGFSCEDCVFDGKVSHPANSLIKLLEDVSNKKYANLSARVPIYNSGHNAKVLFDYLCHQFNINENSFKSLSSVL